MRDSKKVIDGQYYTSAEVCNFMVGLSTKDPVNSRVLETGCGEGAFVDALLKSDYKDIVACDIDEENIIQHVSVNALDTGRNADEVLRTLKALRAGGLTGCSWQEGEDFVA